MRWPTRAALSPSSPRASAICDRCGFQYTIDDLDFQMQYTGIGLYNTGKLVCDRCYDTPNAQLLARVVGPDPQPVPNARPRKYSATAGLAAQTVLILDQMENWPSQHVLLAMDALVVAGIVPLLSKLDFFYMALEDYQQSTINWAAPGNYTLQPQSTELDPQLLALEGFKGISGTSALSTGFQPSMVSAKMQNTSAHLGIVGYDGLASAAAIGNAAWGITSRTLSGNSTIARLATPGTNYTAFAGASTTSTAHCIATRSDDTSLTIWRSKVPSGTIAAPVGATDSSVFWLCGANRPTPAYESNMSVRCAHGGSALTPAEVGLLTDAVSDFIAAIGSPL